jgi:sulfatase maturation enzyme AslB (radical SAM superfamily)
MRCRSCGPQLSTGWYEDTKKLWGHLPDDVPDPGKNKNMWEEIVPLFDIVEEIYFAGGEPLIMEEHYRILNKLVDMGKTNVRIRYNTNFSRMQYKKMNVLDVWSKFDSVSVGASLDAHNKAGEYIRKGTIWPDIVKNRLAMIEKAPNADFFITCTVSVLNSFRIINFHKYLVEQGLISHPRQMHLNFVQDPSYLRIQILPQHLKDKLTIEYQEYAEVLRKQDCNPLADNFIALVDYMNSSDQTNLISQFKLRQQQIDVVRNENLIDVLPELAELYND